MKKLFPLILGLLGLGGGVAAGHFLKPAEEAHGEETACAPTEAGAEEVVASDIATIPEFVKMNNQFVVPVIDEGKVVALVVMSISLEVNPGQGEVVYQREPKLRDGFLRVLFDHANTGGFEGAFTENGTMKALRSQLFEMAQTILGKAVKDVLITDIVRQDNE